MKTKSSELNLIWDELCEIFMEYSSLSPSVCRRLTTLGYRVEKGNKHTKVYMPINGSEQLMVISTTPSDKQAGRQILRQIRRMYERQICS